MSPPIYLMTAQRERAIVSCHKRGDSLRVLQSTFRHGQRTIRRVLAKHAIPPRGVLTPEQELMIVSRYQERQEGVVVVAAFTHRNHDTVRRVLARHGVALRSRKQMRIFSAQPSQHLTAAG